MFGVYIMALKALLSLPVFVLMLFLVDLAHTSTDEFNHLQAVSGKVCVNTGRLASYNGVSLLHCLSICSRRSAGGQPCVGGFYKDDLWQCFLCRSIDDDNLVSIEGTVYWKKNCSQYLVQTADDSQLTESSTYRNFLHIYKAEFGRLDTVETTHGTGGWIPHGDDPNSYIQVDFQELKRVTGVVTQGRSTGHIHYQQWVSEYNIMVSSDCSSWTYVTNRHGDIEFFPGNTDEESHVTNVLERPLETRCVRVHPTKYNNYASMRFDVLGCDI